MGKFKGKKVKLDDEGTFKVVKHVIMGNDEVVLLERPTTSIQKEEEPKHKKFKKGKLSFVFGDLPAKRIKCKKIKFGHQLGYEDYDDISYPAKMHDLALEILLEELPGKLPVSFFEDGEQVKEIDIDCVAIDPKDSLSLIVRDESGSTTKVPLIGMLEGMLFRQEMLAANEAVKLGCKSDKNKNTSGSYDAKSGKYFSDDRSKPSLDHSKKKILDDINEILNLTGFADKFAKTDKKDLPDGILDLLSSLEKGLGKPSRGGFPSDISNMPDIPDAIKNILKDILK